MGNPDALNRYLYAGDNPVNEVDPSGKATGDCGTAFLSLISQGFGLARAGLTLESALSPIVFFAGTLTWTGGSLPGGEITFGGPVAPASTVGIAPFLLTGTGTVEAVAIGYAILEDGTVCGFLASSVNTISW